ncbi:MAG: hypothetical protein QF570_19760 [Myxococcota bacterium]|nr:hypothetical protein [Myxococcota bacterium]
MRRRRIGHTRRGIPVHAFVLDSASGVRVILAEFGASVLAVETPDRSGRRARVCGFEQACDIAASPGDAPNHAASDGGDAGSLLESLQYNRWNGSTRCALVGHDGDGLTESVWWGEALADGVRFHYQSPRSEDGRDGEVGCSVEYRLDALGTLRVEHTARCEQAVAIDLVTPLAFELGSDSDGSTSHATRHEVQIASRHIVECDATGHATGHLRGVAGSPLDRRTRQPLAATNGDGYCYLTSTHRSAPTRVAELWEPQSGRHVEVSSTRPAVWFEATTGTRGAAATVLCPRNFPSADRHAHFPDPRLQPPAATQTTTSYRFGVDT